MAGQVGGGFGAAGDLELGGRMLDTQFLTVFSARPSSSPIWPLVPPVRDQGQQPLLLGGQAGQLLVLEEVLAPAQPVEHALLTAGSSRSSGLDRADRPAELVARICLRT